MFFEPVKKCYFLTKGGGLTAAHAPFAGGGRRARLQAEKYFLRRTCRRRKCLDFLCACGRKLYEVFVSGAYSPPGCGFATRKIMRGVSVLAFVFGAMDSVMNELPPMTEFAPMTVLPPRMDAPE